jgi:xanthine/uracil permease
MKTKNLPLYILAVVIVVGFFVLLGLLIFKEIPPQNKDLLNIVIGTLLAAFMSVVSYWYGSSKGSADKTEMFKKPE